MLKCPARAMAAAYEKAQLTACPGVPELKLVQKMADVPHNSRLKFNPVARTATPAQKEELLRRDGYRCCVPGCRHDLWLEAHHLIEYSVGGETDWKNLRIICWSCHRNVHRGLLKIARDENGKLTFTDAAGRNLRRAQDMERAGWLNYWQGWLGELWACHKRRAADGDWEREDCSDMAAAQQRLEVEASAA